MQINALSQYKVRIEFLAYQLLTLPLRVDPLPPPPPTLVPDVTHCIVLLVIVLYRLTALMSHVILSE